MRGIFYIIGVVVVVLDIIVQLDCQEPLECVQVHRLELPEPLHPDRRCAHCVGFQLAPLDPPALFLSDQASARQDRQVFRDCRQRHLERLGHVGDGHIIL